MRQRSIAEQSSQPPTSLHPVLQAALNSMDVDLEEELARYRRLQGYRPDHSERKALSAQEPHQPSAPFVAGPASLKEHGSGAVPVPASYQPLPATAGLAATARVQPIVSPPSLTGDEGMPSDYLASSEELLRGLADEEAALPGEPPEPRLIDTLLTPLGIGSLLLLLLSTLSFGYLIFNPESMRLLGFEQWFNPSDSAESGAIAQSSEATRPMAAPSPDLAAEEFPELNLDTLSALPPNSPSVSPVAASPVPTVQTSPLASPSPASVTESPTAAPRAESTASRAAASAASGSQASSPRVAAAPVLSPAPVVPPTAAPRPSVSPSVAAAPTPASLYYVVTPYSSDRSLEQVRRVVGDAYVRNYPNGARVQAGAFSEAGRARALVQELSQQGISAEIIQRPAP